LAMSL